MRLYILRPIEGQKDDPWEPWYDKAFGFVIRAEDEQAARIIANSNAGDENGWSFEKSKNVWLDTNYSTCTELTYEGERQLIIRDFHYA